jgi:hypothetical protein
MITSPELVQHIGQLRVPELHLHSPSYLYLIFVFQIRVFSHCGELWVLIKKE